MGDPKGSVYEEIVKAFEDIGYITSARLINSATLLPQYRLRIYIVAIRKDLANTMRIPLNIPQVENNNNNNNNTHDTTGSIELRRSLEYCFSRCEEVLNIAGFYLSRRVRDILTPLDHPYNNFYSIGDKSWKKVRTSQATIRYGIRGRIVIPEMDDECWTLISSYFQRNCPHGQYVIRDKHTLKQIDTLMEKKEKVGEVELEEVKKEEDVNMK